MSKPSSLLESLIPIDDAQLRLALSKHFYPAMDSMRHRNILSEALEDTEKEFLSLKTLMADVDLEERKRSFEADWEAAEASQDLAVWRETEEKWLTIICGWLSTLWQLAVEKRFEQALVQECLVFCEDVMCRLVPPSRIAVDWQATCVEVRIIRSSGSVLFKHHGCPLGYVLAWMWMELLIDPLAKNSDSKPISLKDAVTALQKSNIAPELRAFLGVTPVVDTRCTVSVGNITIRHHTSHWSSRTRDRLSQLRMLFCAPEIQTFKASPTYCHFDLLNSSLPSLRTTLLDVTREKVRGNMRSRVLRIKWEDAASIYGKWGNGADRTDLVGTLAVAPMDEHVLVAQLTIFNHFGPFGTSQAGDLMNHLLEYTLRSCWLQIAEVYPGWDDAWDWLDEAVEDGRLPRKEMPDATLGTEQQQRRDHLVQWNLMLLGSAASAEDEKPVVSLAGRKRHREEGTQPSGWGVADDVRRCLKELGRSVFAVKERVDVKGLARSTLGSNYLASVEGIFDALYNNTSESHVRAGLSALRDVLRGKWDVEHDYTAVPVDVPVERPAKKSRRSGA